MSERPEEPPIPGPDAESRAWVSSLQASGQPREEAQRRLYALLLRAARFEVGRRRAAVAHVHGDEFDDLAQQAAADAMVAILAKLSQYRGDSRFTSWAYKFALLEAGVKLRRRAWQGREIALDPEDSPAAASWLRSPAGTAEDRELLTAISAAMRTELSPHQREVLIAVALNDVPIDVLADRLDSTRGALYKTIHDARKKLRAQLAEQGLSVDQPQREHR